MMFARVRRVAVLLSALAYVVATTAAMASAQPGYPAHRPTCQVSDGTVAPGESVTVSGTNWRPNFIVTIALKGDGILGTATTDSQGSFSTVVTIPLDAPLGSTEIMCRGQRPNRDPFVLGTMITIVAAGGVSTVFTGAQLEVWMILAIAFFGVGLGLILISRRRRTSVRQ